MTKTVEKSFFNPDKLQPGQEGDEREVADTCGSETAGRYRSPFDGGNHAGCFGGPLHFFSLVYPAAFSGTYRLRACGVYPPDAAESRAIKKASMWPMTLALPALTDTPARFVRRCRRRDRRQTTVRRTVVFDFRVSFHTNKKSPDSA